MFALRKRIFLYLLTPLILTLSSCTGMVITAGAVGGIALVKHRTLMAIKRDHHINATLSTYWHKHKPNHSHLTIETYHGIVLLAGQVTTAGASQSIIQFAHQVPGVRRVYNAIIITRPFPLSHRSKDTWITTKVKTHLLTNKTLPFNTIKVITFNRTVYLMGIVTPREANQAKELARTVQGVSRVVTLFQYKPEQ